MAANVGAGMAMVAFLPVGLWLNVFQLPKLGFGWSAASAVYLWGGGLGVFSSVGGAVAWTIASKRLPAVLANTSGFVYYVSITGITGMATPEAGRVADAVARIKRHTSPPVAVGFGIVAPVIPLFAHHFGVGRAEVGAVLSAFAFMRLASALGVGRLVDAIGERVVLASGIGIVAVSSALAGFAHSYHVFLILCLLYGIGMGGEWGVGASLAMESVPVKWRGILSGVLQEGYALGNLLAAVAFVLLSRRSSRRCQCTLAGC